MAQTGPVIKPGTTLAQINARRRQRRGGLNINYGAGNFTMVGTPRGSYRSRAQVWKAPTHGLKRLPNTKFPKLNSVGQVNLSSRSIKSGSNIPKMGGM